MEDTQKAVATLINSETGVNRNLEGEGSGGITEGKVSPATQQNE